MTHALATFQREMNDIFQDQLGQFVVFLGGILIYSCTLDEHYIHVHFIQQILQGKHFYVKMLKCEFVKRSIT